MINANQTGEKISKLRKEQNLTQKELAERLHVTSAAVSKWERGLNFPDLLLLDPLSDILKTSPAALLGLENEPADTVLTKITEISREELTLKKAARKKQFSFLLAAFAIFFIFFSLFLFLGRDTPENNSFLRTFAFQNILFLPQLFGFAAWGFGIAAVLSCHKDSRYKNYSILSFCFCAAALYVTILIFDSSLRIENFASIDDTAWAYHFCSMALLLGTVLLNLCAEALTKRSHSV